MTKRRIVIIGAGGQAREVEWLIRANDRAGKEMVCRGFVVSDLARLGLHDREEGLLGDYEWLRRHRGEYDGLAIGIGSPESRQRVAADLLREFPESLWPALIHPSAIFDQDTCAIGAGVIVSAGVILTVNVALGPFVLANFGCTIGHETSIGRASVINPGANISGGVEVGQGVLVGTGAQILQYLKVGDGARVGAGAVVTRDIGAGLTVTGVPAEPRRER